MNGNNDYENHRKRRIRIRKERGKIVLIMISFVFMLPSTSIAQTKIDGVGGLKWGDSIKKFDSLGLTRFKEEEDCVCTWGPFAGIKDVGLCYCFDKDRFYCFNALIKENAAEQFKILKKALTAKYGKPVITNPLVLKINPNARVGEENAWQIKDVSIWLKFNDFKQEINLSYYYVPILNEQEKEKEKSVEEIKKGL